MDPWVELCVFRTDGSTDVEHVVALLGPPSEAEEDAATARGATRAWVLSSGGLVVSTAFRAHVDWLLAAIADKDEAIARLCADDYWVCVFYHYLWQHAPEPAEAAAIDAELERRDITFDLELEREDFP